MPAILWTNTMTEKGAEKYLANDDYIIQIWTKGEDHDISDIIKKGYKTIFSNYDAWYFDCGYAGWVSDGNNWCAPYKGKNRPEIVKYPEKVNSAIQNYKFVYILVRSLMSLILQ